MATFLDIADFGQIIDTEGATQRSGLACRLYADFEAGALDERETRAALSIFRAIVRDRDPSVRARFARFVAASNKLACDLASHMAGDISAVALPIIAESPCLSDAALVDLSASRDLWRQIAIARRAQLSPAVCAAVIEVTNEKACVALLRNRGASIPALGFQRLLQRFPDHHELRALLLERPGAPASLFERHVTELADRLSQFVTASGWLDEHRAQTSAGSAVDMALIAYASTRPPEVLREAAQQWAEKGRVTAAFLIRASLCGSGGVLEHAVAAQSRIPVVRIRALLRDRAGYGFGSLCARMGYPGDLANDLSRILQARSQVIGRNPHAPAATAIRSIIALACDRGFLPRNPLSPLGIAVLRDVAAAVMSSANPSGSLSRRAA